MNKTILDSLLDISFDCEYEYTYDKSWTLVDKTSVTFREIYCYLTNNEPGMFRDLRKHLIPFYLLRYMWQIKRHQMSCKTPEGLSAEIYIPKKLIKKLIKIDVKKLKKEWGDSCYEYLDNNNLKVKDELKLIFYGFFLHCMYVLHKKPHPKIKEIDKFNFKYDIQKSLLKFINLKEVTLCPYDLFVFVLEEEKNSNIEKDSIFNYIKKFEKRSSLYTILSKNNLLEKM